MAKVLLVGEANPYGADPRFALYPEPCGSAGARLCAVLGMTDREYLNAFDRWNLCTLVFSMRSARHAAARLTARYRVLLGARVTAAHGLAFEPFCNVQDNGWRGVILPHPSGRSRVWNDWPQARARAKALVFDLVALARRSREPLGPEGGAP